MIFHINHSLSFHFFESVKECLQFGLSSVNNRALKQRGENQCVVLNFQILFFVNIISLNILDLCLTEITTVNSTIFRKSKMKIIIIKQSATTNGHDRIFQFWIIDYIFNAHIFHFFFIPLKIRHFIAQLVQNRLYLFLWLSFDIVKEDIILALSH